LQKLRYLALLDTLKCEIRALPPNTVLPTEQQIAERFQVSRVTVRRALDLIERAGMVTRARGRGTIVSPPKITRNMVPFTMLEDDFRRQGVPLETEVLDFQAKIELPDFVRELLRLKANGTAGCIALLRRVDRRVICVEKRYFPTKLARRFEPAQVHSRPVLEQVRQLAGAPVTSFSWDMEFLPATGEAAAVLGITPGATSLVSTSTEFLEDGTAVQVNHAWYRLDHVKFRFSVEQWRMPNGSASS
jgi:GntR family transcriptional regulator